MGAERDVEGCMLHVGRSRGCHEPEEDEDEELAEPEVAIGPGAARIGPARQTAQESERNEPPGDAGREDEPGDPGDCERDECGDLDLPDGGESTGNQSHRPDALLVGSTNAVGVVVHVVRADLDPQRNQEHERGVQPREISSERDATGAETGCARGRRAERGVATRQVSRGRADRHRDDGSRKGTGRAPASHWLAVGLTDGAGIERSQASGAPRRRFDPLAPLRSCRTASSHHRRAAERRQGRRPLRSYPP